MFDINLLSTLSDYQRSNFYRAKVISLDDPLNLNRIQISIYGLTDDIPDESQPWAELQFTAGISTYPIVDDVIWLFFDGGDIFRPIYLGTTYAGTDIDSTPGYEKFSAYLNATKESGTARGLTSGYDFIAIKNLTSYRAALRTANNIDTNKQLSMKDTVSHYDVLTPESTWWRKFEGLDVDVSAGPVAAKQVKTIGSRDARFGPCPIPSGQKAYPWYELRETAPDDWKKVYGGWRFLSEDDLKKGKAYFPDNLRRTYLKRYKSWVKWFTTNPQIVSWTTDASVYAGVVADSWDFIPLPPTTYYDPEMAVTFFFNDTESILTQQERNYRQTKSFPFGKMKIKNRKHYKQSTWLSYDGKSAIELDDNENYERLRIDFNYGEGGLEFSRVGFHGVELWTEGSFKIRGWGRCGTGKGGGISRNSIEGIDSDLYVLCDKFYGCGGTAGASMGSQGPVEVKSKLDSVAIVGSKGISLMSMGGMEKGRGESNALNEGTFCGVPIISGNGKSVESASGLNGWIPVFSNKSQPEATEYFKSFNSSVLMMRKLIEVISNFPPPGSTLPTVAVVVNAIHTWATAAKAVTSEIAPDKSFDAVSIMGAWRGITMEADVRSG